MITIEVGKVQTLMPANPLESAKLRKIDVIFAEMRQINDI